jgi:hypothetical protein
MADIPITAEEFRYHLVRIATPEDGPFTPGRATGFGFSPEEVVRALRETPDGAGLEAFFRRLESLRADLDENLDRPNDGLDDSG